MEEIRNNEPINPRTKSKPKGIVTILIVCAVFAVLICLLLLGWLSWKSEQKAESIPVSTEYVYNDGHIGLALTDEPFGLSQEIWNQEELAEVIPASLPEKMSVQAFPQFTEAGSFYTMRMEVTVADSHRRMDVQPKTFNSIVCEEPIATVRGAVTYILCQERWDTKEEDRLFIAATATIDYVDWFFMIQGSPEEETEMKVDFEELLDSFGDDPPQRESIYEMKPRGNVVAYEKVLSWEEALEDPEFGTYVLTDIPNELKPNQFLRTNNSDENSLNCFWAEDYWDAAYLDWHIREYNDFNFAPNYPQFSAEELALADIQALYEEEPLPANGANKRKRKFFSIVFEEDNIAIYIRTQDIDPEWLYEQIISLR